MSPSSNPPAQPLAHYASQAQKPLPANLVVLPGVCLTERQLGKLSRTASSNPKQEVFVHSATPEGWVCFSLRELAGFSVRAAKMSPHGQNVRW